MPPLTDLEIGALDIQAALTRADGVHGVASYGGVQDFIDPTMRIISVDNTIRFGLINPQVFHDAGADGKKVMAWACAIRRVISHTLALNDQGQPIPVSARLCDIVALAEADITPEHIRELVKAVDRILHGTPDPEFVLADYALSLMATAQVMAYVSLCFRVHYDGHSWLTQNVQDINRYARCAGAPANKRAFLTQFGDAAHDIIHPFSAEQLSRFLTTCTSPVDAQRLGTGSAISSIRARFPIGIVGSAATQATLSVADSVRDHMIMHGCPYSGDYETMTQRVRGHARQNLTTQADYQAFVNSFVGARWITFVWSYVIGSRLMDSDNVPPSAMAVVDRDPGFGKSIVQFGRDVNDLDIQDDSIVSVFESIRFA